MNQTTDIKSIHRFLLFNITLLLTFPLTHSTPLILRLLSTNSLILSQWLPALIYFCILSSSFIGRKDQYTALTRVLCLLFCAYHLIHLFFSVS